jgi:uncharacterized protein YeaO (DUF488 family)
MKIQTSTMRYAGHDKLDITVKSGNRVFAPTWDMVMGHKEGRISNEEYTDKYIGMMRLSWQRHQADWLRLLKQEVVTLCCYCPAGNFCHRHILKQLLEKACEVHGVEFVDGGEV